MTFQSVFDAISPIDEFYGRDARVFDALHPFLSAAAAVGHQIEVELALLKGYARMGLVDANDVEALSLASKDVTAALVAERELRTRHDVVGLVQLMRERARPSLRPYVHLAATSQDIVDTANALRYRRCVSTVLGPMLTRVAEGQSKATETGFTKGLAYADRLRGRAALLETSAQSLRGKLSGAVGTYASVGLVLVDPRTFERSVLAELAMTAAVPSTQIVPPEGWVDLSHASISTLGVLADLARSLPSPTGARVHSLWIAFVPRAMTALSDQISEHQRDFTNSASQRFLGEQLAAVTIAVAWIEDALLVS